MNIGVNGKPKFKFSAKVEYVTEELDHNGNLYYMFNIKVVADPENANLETMQWSVIKSEDEFLQTHKVLRNKYGLLKSFQFRNPSAIGSNMFHLTHAVKPRREKKDEYLTQILELDPIPDEVVAFLCLDNASFFKDSSARPTSPSLIATQPSVVSSADAGSTIYRKTTPTPMARAVSASSATAVATPVLITERERKSKQWWFNAGLAAALVAAAGGAAVLSGLASSVGRATGISRSDSMAMMVYLAVTQYIHFQLVLLRARLEVVVIFLVVFGYAHRVIGYALGVYLRSLLDANRSGKFNFHFEWISLRVGLDQNMLVIHGLEWRNPPMFKHTPYLLRIDEISFVFDPVSVYNAIKSKTAIKIHEIRFNKVALYMEKLTEGGDISAITAECSTEGTLNDRAEQESVSRMGTSAKQKSLRFEETVKVSTFEVSDSSVSDTQACTTTTTSATNITGVSVTTVSTLKPGVLNLWAAMGATNPQQEASMLTNVSGQMSSAMEGTTNMVSVLGSAVAKYNPASMLLKGGASLGGAIGSTIGSGTSLIGNTIGSGVGYLRGKSTTKVSTVDLENDRAGDKICYEEGNFAESEEATAMRRAIDESLQESADILDDAEAESESASPAPASPVPSGPSGTQSGAAGSTGTGASSAPSATATAAATTAATTSTSADSGTSTGAAGGAAAKGPKKGFGLPYELDIQALLLDNLELHTQDFLNASHAEDFKASVIKLKALSMSHRELTKPPKGDSTKKADAVPSKSAGKRRPLYLDDVVWRLVNKLLAELLRNNSIAMMVLLSSAAANNATSVVSSAGSLAYGGAATTKKVLSSVGSTVIGTMFTSTSAVKGSSGVTVASTSGAVAPGVASAAVPTASPSAAKPSKST